MAEETAVAISGDNPIEGTLIGADEMVVELPGGHSAVFRTDVDNLTGRDLKPFTILQMRMGMSWKKALEAAKEGKDLEDIIAESGMTDAQAELFLLAGKAAVVVLLRSWTLPYPKPRRADDLLDLPARLVRIMEEQTATVAARVSELLSGDGFSVAAAGDEDSPTGASGA